MSNDVRALLGADVGGTFTDIVLAVSDGTLHRRKVPSTPPDFGRAITAALPELLDAAGLRPEQLDGVLHATTAATNAVLELRGATTALVTTEGFRDVLEIGRGRRPSLFDLSWQKPVPLVPRERRFEVRERIAPDGTVEVPLRIEDVDRIAAAIRESDVEAVAVCLINSYADPTHERTVAERLEQQLPGVVVSASYDVLPAIREYERTSTTCVNAYLRPLMQRYLTTLGDDLRTLGATAPLRIMQSNGGLTAAEAARSRPVYVIESGPGAGVMAAIDLGRRHGTPNVIAFDMGGTTAKATLIEEGRAHEAAEYEVGGQMTASRLLRGGGYAIGAPAIDIAEVGAGGGSIVSIDAGGAPQVGPHSAGSVPGPVCYGRGGDRATVTDANVVLGYLNPHEIGGGSQAIDAERAAWAIDTQVAEPLGLDRLQAAWGVHLLANSNMGRAVRAVSMQRARDPRDFTLMAFGGSGPIHAAGLARMFQIAELIVPPSPGLLSAIGLIGADETHDEIASYTRGSELDIELVRHEIERLTAAGADALAARRHGEVERIERSLDVRYAGQSFELTVALDDGPVDAAAVQAAREAFDREHQRTYGHALPEEPIEIVNIRVRRRRVDASRTDALHAALSRVVAGGHAGAASRPAYFGPDLGTVETPVITRPQIPADGLAGPVLVEEMDTTAVVPPGAHVRYEGDGSLRIEVSADA